MSLICGAAACSSETEESAGPVALYDVPQKAADYDLKRLPFPSDLMLRDGKLALSELPLDAPAARKALLKRSLETLDGYSLLAAVHFPIDGLIDRDTLKTEQALLFDLDEAAAKPIPTRIVYDAQTKEIVVGLQENRVLREHNRYGLALRSGAENGDGDPLHASPTFARIRDAETRPEGEAGRAYDQLRPLLKRLDHDGIARDQIVAATTFTTQSIASTLVAIREQLRAAKPPAITVGKIFPNGNHDLDAYFGVPKANKPGRDNEGGVVHDEIAFVVNGTYQTPLYNSAKPQQHGFFETENGHPKRKGSETVHFTLMLPDVSSWKALPLVIFQHGINDDRSQMFGIANQLAKSGIGMIGIDAPFHGSRAKEAKDEKANLSDAKFSDGIGDKRPGISMMHFFGIAGSNLATLHPLAVRDAQRQTVVDILQLVQVVARGDLGPLHALKADSRFSALSFKRERLTLVSSSFGSMMGAVALAVSRSLNAGALSVGGGGLMFHLLPNSPTYGPLMGTLFKTNYDARAATDDPKRPPWSQLSFSLFQTLDDRADPLSYAPRMLHDPLAKDARKHVLLIEAYRDESMPNVATEALAHAMGLEWLKLSHSGPGPREPKAFTRISPPARGNVVVGAKKSTAVIAQYDPAGHGLDNLQDDRRTVKKGGPPFIRLDKPQTIQNPIAEVQRQITEFVSSYERDGVPRAIDPYASASK